MAISRVRTFKGLRDSNIVFEQAQPFWSHEEEYSLVLPTTIPGTPQISYTVTPEKFPEIITPGFPVKTNTCVVLSIFRGGGGTSAVTYSVRRNSTVVLASEYPLISTTPGYVYFNWVFPCVIGDIFDIYLYSNVTDEHTLKTGNILSLYSPAGELGLFQDIVTEISPVSPITIGAPAITPDTVSNSTLSFYSPEGTPSFETNGDTVIRTMDNTERQLGGTVLETALVRGINILGQYPVYSDGYTKRIVALKGVL